MNARIHVLRAYSTLKFAANAVKRGFTRSRALRFYSAFVGPGDRVFDVGANYGHKTTLFLALGANVVAIEPQTECISTLKRRFGRRKDVKIVNAALGDREGVGSIRLSDVRSPISSMSSQWIDAVKASGRFRSYEWSRSMAVDVTTLDRLIEIHGRPAFVKIDVEGYELEVLLGLSRPIQTCSFEFHREYLDPALQCVRRLDRLGDYRFNYVIGNRHSFVLSEWTHGDELRSRLSDLESRSLQGDVYARLD